MPRFRLQHNVDVTLNVISVGLVYCDITGTLFHNFCIRTL